MPAFRFQIERIAAKRSAGSFYGNQMAVVGRYLHADLLTDVVDPCSHHTDDMNFTVGTQFDKITDLSTHVTAVFDAALEVVHPLYRFEFIPGKGIEALGANDHLHRVALRESAFIFCKEDIAGLNFDVYVMIVDIDDFTLNEIGVA